MRRSKRGGRLDGLLFYELATLPRYELDKMIRWLDKGRIKDVVYYLKH